MVFGIGTDIIEISRIAEACTRKHFLNRVYTQSEIKQTKLKSESLAVNFAAKEAVSKAFGTGFSNFGFDDIEVLRDELGKPYVNLFGNAKEFAKTNGISKIFVSLSHSKELAIAYVILEKGSES